MRNPAGKIFEAFTRSNALVSVAVVALGFLAATLILLATGRNPAGMYEAIIQSVSGISKNRFGEWIWNPRYTGEWLVASIPLILCGLSM